MVVIVAAAFIIVFAAIDLLLPVSSSYQAGQKMGMAHCNLFALLLIHFFSASSQPFESDVPHNLKYGPSYTAAPPPYYGRETTESTTLRPFIDPATPTNVTVIKGRTVIMACVVRNLGTASVSWMRISDLNVLTMNEITNTKDPRIRSIHVPGSDRWALRIQDTTSDDSGIYECQVTTPIKTIELITLNVLDPNTTILGPREVYLSKGSTLNLTCVIRQGPERQPFIIWTHNSKMLQYIESSEVLAARSHSGDEAAVISQIVVAETAVSHSGTYRCEPGAAPAAEVLVHVLDGKLPAAMQRGCCLHAPSRLVLASACLFVILFRKWRAHVT